MVGNARGGAIAGAGVSPAVSDGYQVSGLAVNDIVTMDFTGSGIRVHASQTGAQVANCVLNTISITATGGTVTFFPATAGEDRSTGANVMISVNTVPMQAIRYRSIDLVCEASGPGMVTVADFNRFRYSFLNLPPYSQTDPACDFGGTPGLVDAFDLGLFRAEFLCGIPVTDPPAICTQAQCSPCP